MASTQRHQRLYRAEEVCEALEGAEFTGVRVCGSPSGAAFDPAASKAMWVFGERG